MKFIAENKKYYFCVMVIELLLLSCIYWFFFDLTLSSFLVYFLSVSIYVTGYRYWITKFNKKEHFLIDGNERFTIINLIFLSFILSVNHILNPAFYNDMFYVYSLIFIIFVLYYVYRIKKQKKSSVPVIKFSITSKIVTVTSIVFLLFDFFIYLCSKSSIQLILYIPFLFLILMFLLFIYTKEFSFNSFFAAILFFNVYIISTILLVLNAVDNNFFSFTVIIHFIVFLSVLSLMNANSTETKDKSFAYGKELMCLLFANTVLIFISLNNIMSFQMPAIFLSYVFFITILFISYIVYHNYKMYIN